MEKNNARDTAREFIKTAKKYFNNKIDGFTLYSVTDEPYKMFSIKFCVYNFYVVILNYKRGHFGCAISYGDDAISLNTRNEWEDNSDLIEFWSDIDKQLKLRIPDKFLDANGWK
ncbi:hypothetical protein [Virgibacillus halodenitrificans]|jgi:hypothetical protein|uniref:hypothetical protein n=1 Tax=Virgibacillus halodenitrificans TaxID=1482 RepID=UPI000760DB0E|nr:hypothetical protein [Virgibacillus halodenitrificans]